MAPLQLKIERLRWWAGGVTGLLCILLLLSPLPVLADTSDDAPPVPSSTPTPTPQPQPQPDGRPQPVLPGITISVGGVPLNVEIAATAAQRYMGLSFRKRLAEDAGMLFVYDSERPLTYTMRNTLLPLSIAFVDEALHIVDIQTMDVGPGQLFDSSKPARYALEVNQGWFKRHGIETGAQLEMR